jgi:hypothetical protein
VAAECPQRRGDHDVGCVTVPRTAFFQFMTTTYSTALAHCRTRRSAERDD